MPASPPPLSNAVIPFRDFGMPPQQRDELGLLRVVECSPDYLRLSVHAGCMIVGGMASLIVAGIAFAVYWFIPTTTHTGVSEVAGTSLTIAIFGVLIGPFLLANIGHSMEFDRIRRVIRVTWLYFKTREYSVDRLKVVVLSVKKPAPAPEVKTPPAGSTVAPTTPQYASSVNCFLEGIDQNNQSVQIKISDAALSSKTDWPALASTAIHLSKMFRLPLRIEGAIDQLNETASGQMNTISQLAGGASQR